jgi:hypothetical protein
VRLLPDVDHQNHHIDGGAYGTSSVVECFRTVLICEWYELRMISRNTELDFGRRHVSTVGSLN